jgi:lipopolysaccharide/colanic/teichoic acid biosynthesis glycosyltransferase
MTVSALFIGGILCATAWIVKQVFGALVGQQVRGSVPDYTARAARFAAKRLPAECRQQIEEEWLAELAVLGQKPLSAIKYARGLRKAATEIAYEAGSHCAPPTGSVIAARVRDFSWSAITLVVLAPMLLTISACCIALYGRRQPVFSRICEPGRHGKPFIRLRFTTIERLSDGTYAYTSLGGFLSRSSLAHLPSIVNVLRGDLALVGPPSPFELVGLLDEDELERLDENEIYSPRVRPGIVSWQLLGASGHLAMSKAEARLRDEHRTLRNDAALICHSLRVVFASGRI